MPENITVGRSGEDAACRFLIDNGYRIIERNFQRPWGELDIIAIEPKTKILVFVEVKTLVAPSRAVDGAGDPALPLAGQVIRQSALSEAERIAGLAEREDRLKPEDNLTFSKLEKLKRASALYAGHRSELVTDAGWRIDLVAVELNGPSSVFRHYKNIAA